MKIVFETRFTYFGKSGWRSEASKNAALLFEDSRLKSRLHYFEHITLPSLKSQTDPDFQQIVLSSSRMPKFWRKQLTELCYDVLGIERCKVHFNRWGSAGRMFRRHITEMFNDDGTTKVAQVVLDDDDAVSKDFVEICRHESQAAIVSFKTPQDYVFLSFPSGYSMKIAGDQLSFVERKAHFTNLGLTLVAAATTKHNPFMTSHKQIGDRHPSRIINNWAPSYIRTVHDQNDSRAMHQDSAEIPLEKVQEQFPAIGDFYDLVTKTRSPKSAAGLMIAARSFRKSRAACCALYNKNRMQLRQIAARSGPTPLHRPRFARQKP